jgi:phospholipase C
MPPAEGAVGIVHVLDILTSNPAVWEKTALIISYDENGGLFDHVPPPVAPPGTPGEYITAPLGGVAESGGIAGPIGLGFRVPCVIISPYSRGGLVSSDVFDHTSQLKFLERRFGVPVPNLSAWRRGVTGDLTSAFDFARPADDAPPPLPGSDLAGLEALIRGNVNLLRGTLDRGDPYPVPPNSMPVQETLPLRGHPSGLGTLRGALPRMTGGQVARSWGQERDGSPKIERCRCSGSSMILPLQSRDHRQVAPPHEAPRVT